MIDIRTSIQMPIAVRTLAICAQFTTSSVIIRRVGLFLSSDKPALFNNNYNMPTGLIMDFSEKLFTLKKRLTLLAQEINKNTSFTSWEALMYTIR